MSILNRKLTKPYFIKFNRWKGHRVKKLRGYERLCKILWRYSLELYEGDELDVFQYLVTRAVTRRLVHLHKDKIEKYYRYIIIYYSIIGNYSNSRIKLRLVSDNEGKYDLDEDFINNNEYSFKLKVYYENL